MRYSILLFILPFAFSCATSETGNDPLKDTSSISRNSSIENEAVEEKPKPMNTEFIISGDSIEIPSFEILVELDENTNKKLSQLNETIIVSASFRGIPKDTLIEEYLDFDHVTIHDYQIELTNKRVARFEHIKIPKAHLEELIDSNLEVLINIYSGRKSSNSNLLDCDILQEPLNDIKGRRITLKGNLLR